MAAVARRQIRELCRLTSRVSGPICLRMETEFSSEGARLLAELMRARGWGRADVAAAIPCNVSMVRRWLLGQRLPDLHTAAKVEAVLGIPCSAWTVTLPPDRPQN